MRSALYRCHVMHRRLRPARHRLSYRLFYLLIDLDEVDMLARRLRLFSHGKFNLFAFHDADHGDRSGKDLCGQMRRLLDQAGVQCPDGPIRLLTMPRLLGHVFNPLSIYFCHDADQRLRAIIYEVSNTFGERHSYVLPVNDAVQPIRQHADKAFHVSPFLPMALSYAFRVLPPETRLAVGIQVSDETGMVLNAVMKGARQALTDGGLLRAAAAYPFMTLKVVTAILWEALILWLKRVPVFAHPAKRLGQNR